MDDRWLTEGGTFSSAEVVDTITDARYLFALIEDEGNELRWYRRVDTNNWVPTAVYEVFSSQEDCSEDDFLEEFSETINSAETELLMAVGYFPRFRVEAEWIDESCEKYVNVIQSGVDDAHPDIVDARRLELFGTLKLI